MEVDLGTVLLLSPPLLTDLLSVCTSADPFGGGAGFLTAPAASHLPQAPCQVVPPLLALCPPPPLRSRSTSLGEGREGKQTVVPFTSVKC